MEEVSGRGIGSIVIGGRLLAALASAGRPLMLRDIAAASDLTRAQAHAYLVSLRKIGVVEQVSESGLYQLGPFALQLGLARMRSVDALRLATRAAPEFAAELGLVVTVTVWGSLGPTVVQVNEAGNQVHVNLRAGTVYSLLHTATGRVFAAFLPGDVVKAHLKATDRISGLLAPATNESTKELLAQVERTRELGYATAVGSPIPGVNAIGAPVFDHTRQLQLTVTVIGLAPLVDLSPGGAPVRRLNAFVSSLSAELGYAPDPDPQARESEPGRPGRGSRPNGGRPRTGPSAEKRVLRADRSFRTLDFGNATITQRLSAGVSPWEDHHDCVRA
jgi:DNA-binding IclR family transcriptional regulator